MKNSSKMKNHGTNKHCTIKSGGANNTKNINKIKYKIIRNLKSKKVLFFKNPNAINKKAKQGNKAIKK
jgi:hypothetical protein